jgi:ATPase subunit of ABC transporter with duplicated ATPase domains
MSATLVAKGLTFSRGGQLVLDGVDLTVAPRMRLGVVGPNGAGKTTLLRLLAGLEAPDSGSVVRAPVTASVGYLPQETDRRPGETLTGFLGRRTGVDAASARLDAAAHALADAAAGADDEYAVALDSWLALGGDDLAERTQEVCADLGLRPSLLDQETSVLSGGEAARAALAAILLSRFDVFLLDEPTNDLDFAGLERLERFVLGVDAGLVVVSHDREFLERTISSVLDIDGPTHRATLFNGGWTAYQQLRAVARQHAREAYEDYEDKRGSLVDMAQRQREMSVRGAVRAKRKSPDNDKAAKGARIEAATSAAGKVKITEKRLERLDAEGIEEPRKEWQLQLMIAAAPRAGDVVATLRGAVVRRPRFTLGPVDLTVGWADRVVITGANGSGKSTLLAALLGRVPLDEGEASLGPGVKVGEVDQARARFRGERPVLQVVEEITGWVPAECRTLLAKFGLKADHVLRAAGSLSPGERTRAGLALLQAVGVNCLVLDEPTNHLDMPAIEQLEDALADYPGTLLLVTHDRRMLDAVATTRRLVVDAGKVSEV